MVKAPTEHIFAADIEEEPAVLAAPTSPAEVGATTAGSATETTTPPAPQAPSLEGPAMTANQDVLPLQTSPDGPPAQAGKRGEDISDSAVEGQTKEQTVAQATAEQDIAAAGANDVARIGPDEGKKNKGNKKSAVCDVL